MSASHVSRHTSLTWSFPVFQPSTLELGTGQSGTVGVRTGDLHCSLAFSPRVGILWKVPCRRRTLNYPWMTFRRRISRVTVPPFLSLWMQFHAWLLSVPLTSGTIQVTGLSHLKTWRFIIPLLCRPFLAWDTPEQHRAREGKGQDNTRVQITCSINWAMAQGLTTSPSPLLFREHSTGTSFILQTHSGFGASCVSTGGFSVTTVRTEKHAGTFTHAEAFDFIPGVQQHFLVQVAWLEPWLEW